MTWAQQVINAACAVQTIRVAQYAARMSELDACGGWVEVDHGSSVAMMVARQESRSPPERRLSSPRT